MLFRSLSDEQPCFSINSSTIIFPLIECLKAYSKASFKSSSLSTQMGIPSFGPFESVEILQNKDKLSKYDNAKGYVATGKYASGYWELYFNLGHFDKKDSTNVQDRQTPLQDANVRKAVGYAMNVGDVTKKYSNGFEQPATTIIVVTC